MVSPSTKELLAKHAKLHGVSLKAAEIVYMDFFNKIKKSPTKKNNKTIKEQAIKKTHDFLRGCKSVRNDVLLGKLDVFTQKKILSSKPGQC
jgi:hypothetical protein